MGQPQERPKGTYPPCHYGPKECAKGSPDSGLSLNPQNLQAFLHYRECRAIGRFPEDRVVRENAAIIRMVEDEASDVKQQDVLISIMQAAMPK